MPQISILPPEIVNRIAAGEVVERPASVVKELLENSVDAHATEMEIELEDGGKKKVTVRDNGCGMGPEDICLAFRSHATSKLRPEDFRAGLFGIASLGFRGEALASIGEVAEVEVVSRPARADHAYRYQPGKGKVEPAAGPRGTVVEARNLFYNVPARRKFLRASSTELSHVLTQVVRLALPLPAVRFRVTQGGRKVVDFPAVSSLRERVAQVVGDEKSSELIEVGAGDGGPLSLKGFIGAPSLRRRDAKEQHFYVNGRWVRDRLLSHALRSAYEGFLIPGWRPVAYLFLELPPESVDVNVHPTKTEVRFRDTGSLYPLVFHAIRQALGEKPAAGVETAEKHAEPVAEGARPVARPAREESGQGLRAPGERIARAARSFLDASTSSTSTPRTFPPRERREPEPSSPLRRGPDRDAGASAGRGAASARREGSAAFQVLDSYIVVEADDALLFIDQHALHEKILFEEIHEKLLRGELVRQKLIVPDVVSLPVEHVPLLERARALLAPCGYEIEPFGEREIAVHTVPELFDRVRSAGGPRDFLAEVFRWLEEEEPGTVDVHDPVRRGVLSAPYRRLASLLACKRAVKAGTRLRPQEIDSLLEQADLADDPRHCPHGRPTVARLERGELERKFDRK
ncbi:MAG: DNA mismatch repair endonuclease MutL [Planctomycetota bacterium]|nr:DNA mismatch repair endonuclease MutL [Planctomycetota bacterium]